MTIDVHGRVGMASEAYLMVTVSRLVVVVWVDVDMTSQGCVAPAQLALHPTPLASRVRCTTNTARLASNLFYVAD